MNMNATAQMVTTTQVGCGKAKRLGAQHHMEACRALLNVPDDEVLYGAIQDLLDALHFYRNHDDNGQTATDALRKVGK